MNFDFHLYYKVGKNYILSLKKTGSGAVFLNKAFLRGDGKFPKDFVHVYAYSMHVCVWLGICVCVSDQFQFEYYQSW